MSGSPAWNCRVYSKNIFTESPVARENKARKVGGPCVRFIEATMRELGKSYDPASILRAMTSLRALQASRSLVRQNNPG